MYIGIIQYTDNNLTIILSTNEYLSIDSTDPNSCGRNPVLVSSFHIVECSFFTNTERHSTLDAINKEGGCGNGENLLTNQKALVTWTVY